MKYLIGRLMFRIQYIPRNMHTVFALLCFVVVIHWLIFPYPSGLLHWHCGNLTIAPVPAKQPWWIWINTSCEFIMNDCITTTKQSTTKSCAYFLGYTVYHAELPLILYIYLIPVRSAIIICHCVKLTWGSVDWYMWALLFGKAFIVLISIQTSASLFSLEVLKQQYVITHSNRSHEPHVLLTYIVTGDVILCYFFLLHPLHPFWNIFAICETDKESNNPTGLPAPFAWCILYYVWWEAI